MWVFLNIGGSQPLHFIAFFFGTIELHTHFGEIKQCKCMLNLKDFPLNSAWRLGWCHIMTPVFHPLTKKAWNLKTWFLWNGHFFYIYGFLFFNCDFIAFLASRNPTRKPSCSTGILGRSWLCLKRQGRILLTKMTHQTLLFVKKTYIYISSISSIYNWVVSNIYSWVVPFEQTNHPSPIQSSRSNEQKGCRDRRSFVEDASLRSPKGNAFNPSNPWLRSAYSALGAPFFFWWVGGWRAR